MHRGDQWRKSPCSRKTDANLKWKKKIAREQNQSTKLKLKEKAALGTHAAQLKEMQELKKNRGG